MTRTKRQFIECPFTVAIDTREQAGFPFVGFKADSPNAHLPLTISTEVKTLKTGDYSAVGFEHRISIERKSPQDAYQTFSHERDRFERELERLAEMEFGAVVIESSMINLVRRVCYQCGGRGFTVDSSEVIPLTLTGAEFGIRGDVLATMIARKVRAMESVKKEVCRLCEGKGTIHPMDHSKFSPKSFWRSIKAWQVRYGVHFECCETRGLAERATFQWLNRFWIEEQRRVKNGT